MIILRNKSNNKYHNKKITINGITANGQMSMMFNDKGEPLND